jgi:large subunit ribosomal protein L2
MAKKKSNPVTPGRRFYRGQDFSNITKKKGEKSLIKNLPGTGGRNSQGRRTADHRGGRVRRKYRTIDFKRNKFDIEGRIKAIEYDPNRSAWIALVFYADGEKRYIIAPEGIKVEDIIKAGPGSPVSIGNSLPLSEIPPGTFIHNIELQPGRGGALARGAGATAQILALEGKYAHVRLPSGEVRLVLSTCSATVGRVGNISHDTISDGKAGRRRWKGRRPRVRGVAKNPVDHPLGGGEGRSAGGRHPVSRTGIPAKGYRTRNPKKHSSQYIIKRRRIKRRRK